MPVVSGGVAAHGGAYKVGTGFGAEHGIFKVIAISHHLYFILKILWK